MTQPEVFNGANGRAHPTVATATREDLWALHQRFIEMGLFPMWVVYAPPTPEFGPDCYVARLFKSLPAAEPTPYVLLHEDLETLRGMLPPTVARKGRSPDDPPHILEVWL